MLTERELQVLKKLGSALTKHLTGRVLGIGETTVKTHASLAGGGVPGPNSLDSARDIYRRSWLLQSSHNRLPMKRKSPDDKEERMLLQIQVHPVGLGP